MGAERYIVSDITKTPPKKVWIGFAENEGMAMEFASGETNGKVDDLKAEIDKSYNPLAGLETPKTIDESVGQDKAHPLNKTRKPRADKGIPRGPLYFLFAGTIEGMTKAEVEQAIISMSSDARARFTVVIGHKIDPTLKVEGL